VNYAATIGQRFSDGTFTVYVIALAISAVLLLLLAVTGFGTPSIGMRVFNAVVGLGFLGYIGWLLFADYGNYVVFFYAFILPVLVIISAVRSAFSRQPAS
jgi:uncharacterized paraquat-inducible protein A